MPDYGHLDSAPTKLRFLTETETPHLELFDKSDNNEK